MEIVSVLRVLRRHRFLVAVGMGLAFLLALSLTFQLSLMPPKLGSKKQTSGVATARVIIAARTQPAFDLESHITDTLGTRAALLADLLSTDAVRKRIAKSAALEPEQIAIITPVMGPATLPVPLAVSATEAAAVATEPYMLTVNSEGQIPIIALRATGPDALRAAKVVNAGIASIRELIASKSAGRPDILVEPLGPAMAKTLVQGPRKAIAGAAAIVVLAMWCTGIVVLEWLARRRRRRPPTHAPRYSPSA
jgi:hypothetical protein